MMIQGEVTPSLILIFKTKLFSMLRMMAASSSTTRSLRLTNLTSLWIKRVSYLSITQNQKSKILKLINLKVMDLMIL